MKIKLTQEQSDFITHTFGCKDIGGEDYDSIYFQLNVFVQTNKDKGTCIFEEKHISELPKEYLLEIIGYMLRNPFNS